MRGSLIILVVLTLTANTPFNAIAVSGDQAFPPEVVQKVDACSTALPFPITGEELTREQFITFLYDDNATKLAKEEFRKIYHVTPAEIHAVPYEVRLDRLLPHKVVLQLENTERFNLGVLCWLYGSHTEPEHLIHQYSFDDAEAGRDPLSEFRSPFYQTIQGGIESGVVVGRHHQVTLVDLADLLGGGRRVHQKVDAEPGPQPSQAP